MREELYDKKTKGVVQEMDGRIGKNRFDYREKEVGMKFTTQGVLRRND